MHQQVHISDSLIMPYVALKFFKDLKEHLMMSGSKSTMCGLIKSKLVNSMLKK